MMTDRPDRTEGRMILYIGQPPANANIQPLVAEAIKAVQANGRIAAPGEQQP